MTVIKDKRANSYIYIYIVELFSYLCCASSFFVVVVVVFSVLWSAHPSRACDLSSWFEPRAHCRSLSRPFRYNIPKWTVSTSKRIRKQLLGLITRRVVYIYIYIVEVSAMRFAMAGHAPFDDDSSGFSIHTVSRLSKTLRNAAAAAVYVSLFTPSVCESSENWRKTFKPP